MPRKSTGGRKVRDGRATATAAGQTHAVQAFFSASEIRQIDGAAGLAGFPARRHWIREIILDAARREFEKNKST